MDVFAAEDEEVGVFGYYALDNTLTFEVGELGVGFVGCDNIWDVLSFQSLSTE